MDSLLSGFMAKAFCCVDWVLGDLAGLLWSLTSGLGITHRGSYDFSPYGKSW